MGILKNAFVKSAKKTAKRMAIREIDRQLTKRGSADALVSKSKKQHKLIATQKIIALTRDFIIKDENGTKIYHIKTDAVSLLTPTMRLYDTEGNELARISKSPTLLHRFAEYDVFLENEPFATIEQQDGAKPYFEISSLKWNIRGDFLKWNFGVYDSSNTQIIGIKEAYSGNKTYVIEYDNEENELFCLFALMVVDLAYHRK